MVDARQDALERAIGKIFGMKEHATRLRLTEAERRIAALEAQIGAMKR